MVPGEFVAFVGKRLHVHDALQGFLDNSSRIGEAILRFPGDLARFPAEHHGDHRQHWQADEHDARQLQRRDGNERDAADQKRGLAKKLRQDGDKRVLDLNQVGGETAGQFTHAALGEERHGERDQSRIGIATQINEAALPTVANERK